MNDLTGSHLQLLVLDVEPDASADDLDENGVPGGVLLEDVATLELERDDLGGVRIEHGLRAAPSALGCGHAAQFVHEGHDAVAADVRAAATA